MPVIDMENASTFPQDLLGREQSGYWGGGSWTARTFADTNYRDCERGNAEAWDEITELNARIERLRQEAKHWLDLEAALETYKVETAGELPAEVFQRHRIRLDKPIMVTI